ncbi:MAG: rhodanese-like domain-containing protein [Lactobacillaceae bacterium]|jgi:rhodanese-related sulfurtransferase|nr:rhodanese-like domain-containing protein [Lactobacillaceae bacterium]
MIQAIITIVILWGAWTLGSLAWTKYSITSGATLLDSAEFEAKSRGGQLIDVRDAPDFKAKHVLGARNIPAQMLIQNATAVRKDKAVFLVDANNQTAARVVRKLKKLGYTDMYVLKGGFAKYTGKVKAAS